MGKKNKKLSKKKRTRLQLEVEGMINSNEGGSSRVLADEIVALVEGVVRGKTKPRKNSKPWGGGILSGTRGIDGSLIDPFPPLSPPTPSRPCHLGAAQPARLDLEGERRRSPRPHD